MTDEELIARLREGLALENYIAAADRIETLTAEVAKLTRSLDIAVQTISESGRLRGQAEAERDAAVKALEKLAAIADAFDDNELDDEARKMWGKDYEHENCTPHNEIELYQGRGGKRLLTLEDCMKARAIRAMIKEGKL